MVDVMAMCLLGVGVAVFGAGAGAGFASGVAVAVKQGEMSPPKMIADLIMGLLTYWTYQSYGSWPLGGLRKQEAIRTTCNEAHWG